MFKQIVMIEREISFPSLLGLKGLNCSQDKKTYHGGGGSNKHFVLMAVKGKFSNIVV